MEDSPSIAARLNRVRNLVLRDRHNAGLPTSMSETGYWEATQEYLKETCTSKFVWTKWSESALSNWVFGPPEFDKDARELHEYFIEHKIDVICSQPWTKTGPAEHVTFAVSNTNANSLILAKLTLC